MIKEVKGSLSDFRGVSGAAYLYSQKFNNWSIHWRNLLWHHLNYLNYLTDLHSTPQQPAGLESSVPVENVYVDKKAVDKLTEGLLSHYLPDLQNSKRALQELTWVFVLIVFLGMFITL